MFCVFCSKQPRHLLSMSAKVMNAEFLFPRLFFSCFKDMNYWYNDNNNEKYRWLLKSSVILQRISFSFKSLFNLGSSINPNWNKKKLKIFSVKGNLRIVATKAYRRVHPLNDSMINVEEEDYFTWLLTKIRRKSFNQDRFSLSRGTRFIDDPF